MAALWMQSHAFLAHSIPENIDMISCFCNSRSEQNSCPKRSPHRRRTTLAQALKMGRETNTFNSKSRGYDSSCKKSRTTVFRVYCIGIHLLGWVVDWSQDWKDQLHFVIPALFLLPGIPSSAGTRGEGYGVSSFLTRRRPKDKHKFQTYALIVKQVPLCGRLCVCNPWTNQAQGPGWFRRWLNNWSSSRALHLGTRSFPEVGHCHKAEFAM